MNCREVQSLIVPFIKSELNMEQAKAFFAHIDHCSDCKEELEVNYILLIGLKQLDEDTSGSLNLHGQFEEHLAKAREQVQKRSWERIPKMLILLGLIGILLVMVTREQEHYAIEEQVQKRTETLFGRLPNYDPLVNWEFYRKEKKEFQIPERKEDTFAKW